MLRVLGRATSGNVQKVLFYLEETGTPYSREDYGRQFNNTGGDYLKLNPNGKVPTVVDSCYGECVSKDQCAPNADEPVACLAFIESSDGVCSRKDDDPCRSQDPDCKS